MNVKRRRRTSSDDNNQVPPSTQPIPQEQLPAITVSLRELYKERQRYIVFPSFQRQDTWTLRYAQAWIDSLLLGDPTPPLEGYQEINEEGETIWGIIDGHQRLIATLDFLDGKYKTWTTAQKRYVEPNSEPPVEPNKFFDQLSVVARNYLLDYRLQFNRVRKRSEQQMVTRFLRIQNHVPLSAAEKLNAYTSKAKEAAKQIEKHPFWEDFYDGKTHREQIFQSSLYLLGLEMTPSGMLDLQSGTFIHGLASGKRDAIITEDFVQRVLLRLDVMSHAFAGMHFTIRAIVIAMYQALIILEQAGYTIQPRDKGKLTSWISAIHQASVRQTGSPSYARPVQRLLYKKVQEEFWDSHKETVLASFGLKATPTLYQPALHG